MSMQPDRIVMCPICLETMKKPILQCERGHSMCNDCIVANNIKKCPQCRGRMTTIRSLQLEQLIESMNICMKIPCFYASQGCTYVLAVNEKESHEQECRYRMFHCEGMEFAKWKCHWRGGYKEIEKHFLSCHSEKAAMEFSTTATTKIDFDRDYADVHLISLFNGSQYIYYKHKVDLTEEKCFWAFQLIGTSKQANHYCYEFEILKKPVQKFKVTEYCEADTVDINKNFREERKCVSISFAALKNYINEDNEVTFRFRILPAKNLH